MKNAFYALIFASLFSLRSHAELKTGIYEGRIQSKIGFGEPCRFSIIIDPFAVSDDKAPYIFKWEGNASWYVFGFTYKIDKYYLDEVSPGRYVGHGGTYNYSYDLIIDVSKTLHAGVPIKLETSEYNYVADRLKTGVCGDFNVSQ